jgi:hypothetical protein
LLHGGARVQVYAARMQGSGLRFKFGKDVHGRDAYM